METVASLYRTAHYRTVSLAAPTEARVWSFSLQCAASVEDRLLALLDPGEAARAARFATIEDRRRYVVSHGVLRLILSGRTGREPQAIEIAIGDLGKPYLAGPGPHFSLSHAADAALVAVSDAGPVGVDLEQVRADVGLARFAGELLPAPEVERIEALPVEERLRAWFQAWTRLEAAAKASGQGLHTEPTGRHDGPMPLRTWDLHLAAPFVGAVAVGDQ